MVAKSPHGKVKSSSSSGFGVRGGSGKMLKEQHVGNMTPGQTAKPAGGSSGKFARGGAGKRLTGTQKSLPQKPGVTSAR
jgi:hypothetical protein